MVYNFLPLFIPYALIHGSGTTATTPVSMTYWAETLQTAVIAIVGPLFSLKVQMLMKRCSGAQERSSTLFFSEAPTGPGPQPLSQRLLMHWRILPTQGPHKAFSYSTSRSILMLLGPARPRNASRAISPMHLHLLPSG